MNGGLFEQAEKAARLTDVNQTKELIQTDLVGEIINKEGNITIPEIEDIINHHADLNGSVIAITDDGEITFTGDLKTKKGNPFSLEPIPLYNTGNGDGTVARETTPTQFSKAYGKIEIIWLDENNNQIDTPEAPILGGLKAVTWTGTPRKLCTSNASR